MFMIVDNQRGQHVYSPRKASNRSPTMEGAGVKPRRAFGFGDTGEFDPFHSGSEVTVQAGGNGMRFLPVSGGPIEEPGRLGTG
jgi:hypothetical protein